jgi:hypothetical protein
MATKPKISNIEWGLVIGALFTVDILQVLLNFFAIVVVINRFITMFMWMAWLFYLKMRGQKLISPKKLGSMIATYIGEIIPLLDSLPLWGINGIVTMMLTKAEEKIEAAKEKIPMGSTITPLASRRMSKNEQPEPEGGMKNKEKKKAA